MSSIRRLSKKIVLTSKKPESVVGFSITADKESLSTPANIARQDGTTVEIFDFLAELPVRRKEWEREKDRSLSKVISTIHTLALVNHGIRFHFINFVSEKEHLNYIVPVRKDILETINLIYGTKIAQELSIVQDVRFSFKETYMIAFLGQSSLMPAFLDLSTKRNSDSFLTEDRSSQVK